MSIDLETTSIVRSWLQTDEHESASRVLGTVLDRLDTTPQSRPWWRAWRTYFKNGTFRFAAAALAMVVVVGIGLAVYFSRPAVAPSTSPSPAPATSTPVASPTQGPTKEPTDSPSPAQSPTPIGTPHTLPLTWKWPPGSDQMGWPETLTLAVPTSWERGEVLSRASPIVLNGEFSAWTVAEIASDQCGSDWIPIGGSVDDLVNAMSSSDLFRVTETQDIVIDGFSGKRVDFLGPARIMGCQNHLWRTAPDPVGATSVALISPTWRGSAWIVDVEGSRFVLLGSWVPAATYVRDEIEAMVASVHIVPWPIEPAHADFEYQSGYWRQGADVEFAVQVLNADAALAPSKGAFLRVDFYDGDAPVRSMMLLIGGSRLEPGESALYVGVANRLENVTRMEVSGVGRGWDAVTYQFPFTVEQVQTEKLNGGTYRTTGIVNSHHNALGAPGVHIQVAYSDRSGAFVWADEIVVNHYPSGVTPFEFATAFPLPDGVTAQAFVWWPIAH